jgi:small neutral amino acid transporter SnatA (MarC family)
MTDNIVLSRLLGVLLAALAVQSNMSSTASAQF